MAEVNKVTVKIYGQEYIISGEMSREHIMRVADYVDAKMHEVAEALPNGSTSSLAVLSAVNAADDYFSAAELVSQLKTKNVQLEKDSQHYVELWDEAKKNFLQYKQEAQSSLEQKDQLQKAVNEKITELTNLSGAYLELEKKCERLTGQTEELAGKNEELTRKLASQKDDSCENSALVKELEAKCKDVESSFFDLQMENIQLKGELDRLKKAAESLT